MPFLETCKVFAFYDFRIKTMFGSSLPPVVCMRSGFMSYLRWLSLLAYSHVPTHIVLCFCLFFFVLCTLCCQFLWIVHFWFSLQYSLTFIRLIGIVNDKTIKVHCHHSGFWLLYWNNKYEVLRALITLMETLRKIEVSKNGTTQTLPGYF